MARLPAAFIAPWAALLFVLSLTLPSTAARAADGFPLIEAPGTQEAPSIAVASDGAWWVAWLDHRRGVFQNDLYVARIPGVVASPASYPGFEATSPVAANGVIATALVCESGTTGPPFVAPVDSGGVLVIFGDSRVPRGIYAQRFRSDLSTYPGWPAHGRLITDDVQDITLAACPDGAGGAWTFRKRAPITFEFQRVAITRITKTGDFTPGWTEDGVVVAGDEQVRGITIAEDTGGAVFSAELYFNGAPADLQVVRAGRISSTGVVSPSPNLPGWRSGNFAPAVVARTVIPDGSGGWFAAWNDAPAPTFYAQQWNGSGAPQWPDSVSAPFMDALVRDGEGGVFLVGRLKQDLNHLAVQRRVPGGGIHPDWDPAGFVVSDPLALANVAAVPWTGYPPGSRGVLVVWSESQGTATGFDLRALHVRGGATLDANWPVGGLALCDVAGNQTSPVVGGGIVVWSDTRNQATSGTDLWWTLLEEAPWPVAVPTPSPGTRTGLAIRSVFPNPAGDGVHVTFAAAAGGAPLRVDLVDLRGRIVRSRSVTSGGDEVRVVVPTEGLPVGLYLVRGVQGEQSAAARVTVLR